ncbi:MAG: VWA domain-containing protein [Bacteroidaceae bacterium]|nr:VWA domain-containing protein [Bacteroidaceae bacterium]MBQ8454413.1 VWA domain-containing protein [Bacteroidaceae bacterium]MBQ9295256.1 VWA domain-containing protein [Bacteroidaceae bacterium]
MFRFASPQYLYFLLVLVALVAIHYYIIYRKRQQVKRFGDPELTRQLYMGVSRWRPEVKFWLTMAALASFIVSLARPQFGTRLDTRERTGIEAIIALDVSNSMLAEDVKPNRLEKAKMMVSNMVDGMRDDKVGLIVFAGQAFVQLPITSDYVSAKMFLETISPSMISVQGTDVAEAINLSMRSFTQQEDVSRAIFVITDGEDNEARGVEAAKQAAAKGVRVYVLGIGNPGGAPIPIPGTGQYIIDEEGNTVVSKLSEEMCREIATAGNGSYIYVDNSSSAQKKLSEQLDRLAKSKMESQIYSEYDEQFQGFILIGLLFLLIDVLLLERESKTTWLGNLFRRGRPVATVMLLFFSMMAMAQTDRDYIRRGNRLMRDSVYDKAQVEYQKAIERDNTNPISHFNLGNALLYQNKAEDAMKEYETAARLEKDKTRLAQIYHNMGVVLQSAKQFDKAVACYRNSLRNDPTNNETRYNYALSLFQLKKNQGGQDNQDQQKDDKGQDEKKEQEQQQQKQEQDKKDQQQQQPQPEQMSRENAEQMLNAAMQDEKATQEKIQKAQQKRQQKQLQKQW